MHQLLWLACREAEFRKTTAHRLTLLKWVGGTKAQPLVHDCKMLASFDVVRRGCGDLARLAGSRAGHVCCWGAAQELPCT